MFTDEYGRLISVPEYSDEDDEDRFILLGTSIDSRLLIVCHCVREQDSMRDHYDFSDSVKNPYAKKLKKQVTIRLDEDAVVYFKSLSENKGFPYQSLINLYLKGCAQSHRDLKM